ncbi:MAG: oxidoreductase [Acidobacteriaceae bacterium]
MSSASATTINVGLIGFGLAGRIFHAPFITAVPGFRLAAIVQRTGDSAAEAYPESTTGVRIVRSVEELLSDAGIRLVVIGTPNPTHFDLARKCLLAGKDVVIDKPLTATSAEARELIELAASKGKTLAAFHNRRWDGDFLTVRQLIASGQLGRIVTFESHFDRFRPIPRAATWKETGELGNGLLFDLGPHLMDQALALFGLPEAISADIRYDRDDSQIEDAFDITLHYPRMRAILRSTMIAATPAPRFTLHGTHGSYVKYGLDPQEPALIAGKRPTDDTWLSEPESEWGTLTLAPDIRTPEQLTKAKLPTLRGDYRNYYANVRDALYRIAPLVVKPQDAYNTIRLLELARESSRSRNTLTCELSLIQ